MSRDRSENGVRLTDRLALRPAEAAELIGLSEGAFRTHLMHRCPKFYAGRSVRIPLRLFEQFLEDLSSEEEGDQEMSSKRLLDRVASR